MILEEVQIFLSFLQDAELIISTKYKSSNIKIQKYKSCAVHFCK